MPDYNDEARTFANLVKDKNRLKAQIAGRNDTIQIGKRYNAFCKTEMWNVVVSVRSTAGEGSWGVDFGDGTDNDGLWNETGYTWQAVPYSGSFVESVRDRWEWNDQTALELGSKSNNVDLNNADIRLR